MKGFRRGLCGRPLHPFASPSDESSLFLKKSKPQATHKDACFLVVIRKPLRLICRISGGASFIS